MNYVSNSDKTEIRTIPLFYEDSQILAQQEILIESASPYT
jgi:hypothetical protein